MEISNRRHQTVDVCPHFRVDNITIDFSSLHGGRLTEANAMSTCELADLGAIVDLVVSNSYAVTTIKFTWREDAFLSRRASHA